jgi:ABC-type branched-subunit amino acid transport system ATPase component
MAEPAVGTKNLVKVYKEADIKAIGGLNLEVRKGEIYALIGANGSGKTKAATRTSNTVPLRMLISLGAHTTLVPIERKAAKLQIRITTYS